MKPALPRRDVAAVALTDSGAACVRSARRPIEETNYLRPAIEPIAPGIVARSVAGRYEAQTALSMSCCNVRRALRCVQRR